MDKNFNVMMVESLGVVFLELVDEKIVKIIDGV
jgi:hypothetical protein